MRLAVLFLAAAVPAPLLAADPPNPGEELFPLAIGNTWTYRVQPFNQPFQDDRFVVRVAGKEMVGDHTCFVLEGKLRDRVAATEHVAFTKNGLTRLRADSADISPPVMVLRFPAAPKGPEVEFQLGERRATARFTQTTAPSTVVVPAGRYRGTTMVVGELGGEIGTRVKTVVWYAAGVGMVKQQIEEGKRNTILELEKFAKGE